MKKLLSFLLLLCAVLPSCSNTKRSEPDPEGYTEPYYAPRYASGFSLLGDSIRMMLQVYSPDTMSVIIPEGGFRSIVCMSSTYVGLLDAVGSADRISAVSGKQYLTNENVKSRVAEVGYEGAMDYESLLAAKPDIALIYGIGGKSAIAGKLEELGVKYIYVNDFLEQDPLGKAEWMVALGALTGRDGRKTFDEIERNYIPISGEAPVMINAPYGGAWFIPGSKSYMTKLIIDAGGQLTIQQPEGTESEPADVEIAIPALNRARIWLNPGQVNTAAEARRLAPHSSFSGSIWNQTPDFYESGAARPDLVLREMQSIFNGTATDNLRYFTPLE